MTVRQADLARELNVSEMTIHRAAKAIHRSGKPLSDLDAIAILAMSTLQTLGLAPHVSAALVSEFPQELRYVAGDPSHRCWIVFIDRDDVSFRLASISTTHLEAILSVHPLSLVLPLHDVVAKASARLDALKTRKEAA